MDLHDRYMNTSATIDFSIFELLHSELKNNPFLLLHRLIRHYNNEIIGGNYFHLRQLNTLRMLLCYEYQLVFNAKEKNKRTISNLCIKNIENSLLARRQLRKPLNDRTILFDIVILQLTLYCDTQCIHRHLINFRQSNVDVLDDDESRSHYLKILECFLQVSKLKAILYNNPRLNSIWKSFGSMYLHEVTSWLKAEDTNKEMRLFASILPKLLDTFGSTYVLPYLCDIILNELDDIEDSLSALSILTDISVNVDDASLALHDLYYTEALWFLIISSLRSPDQQNRKQGIFIMKLMTNLDAICETCSNSVKHEIIPFVCSGSTEIKISIDDIKRNFFLIIEALEEKQHHLIIPALKHLPILVEGNKVHSLCNNCFDNAWVRLVFERILQHGNSAIVRQGILYLCELPILLDDDRFLRLFVHTLNNTFLYEYQSDQQEPEVVDDIVKLFLISQNKRAEFLSRVLHMIAEKIWAPIPIFYMMRILRIVSSKVASRWGDQELNVVADLIRMNLNIGTKHRNNFNVLNGVAQLDLLKTVTLSVDSVNNLKNAMDMLLACPLTVSWNVAVTWLRKVLTQQDALNFLWIVCEEYSYEDPPTKLSPTDFSAIIVMFHETGLILGKEMNVSLDILRDWLSLLKHADVRPYANVAHILYMIEFMSELFEISSVVKIPESVNQLLSLYIHDALRFLIRNTRSIPYKSNYEKINRYFVAITKILNERNSLLLNREILNYAARFRNESIIILENVKHYTSLHHLYALAILHYTQEILSETHVSFYNEPLLSICDVQLYDDVEAKLKGTIASDRCKLLAKLANQFLLNVKVELWPKEIDWFESVSHLHEMGGNEIVPEVASILKAIVDQGLIKIPENKLKLQSIFTIIWWSTLMSTKNYIYFSGMKNLVRIIVNNNFLVESSIMSFVDKFLDELLEEGNHVPRLKKYLLDEMKTLDMSHLNNLQGPLLACLLHGDVLRKDKHIENQVYLYIAKNYEDYCLQNIKIIDCNDDVNVRAMSVILLHKIINEDKTYASTFLPRVLTKLEEYKNKRHFSNSYVHKIKHRIMQILLVIQPTLNKEDTSTLQEFLCNAILLESNQHSVRLMQEWILIRIFLEYTELHDRLWAFFEKAIATRPGCVSSVICIAHHVVSLLPKDLQGGFISTGISYVTRCCLGQHYSMRLYSQIIFVKWFEKLKELNCDRIKLEGLYHAANASLRDGLSKNANRVQDDFYLSTFHATRHYTLETIYFDLPRLSNIIENEWVNPNLFKNLNFKETDAHPLRLYNFDRSLSDTKSSSYLIKSTGDTETSIKDCKIDVEGMNDIQRKPTPSTSLHDIFPTIRDAISHRKTSNEEGLIVVASLVSRAPNLGGLARTCEVFSVKELVIANLNQMQDKEFRNLSVSAENWITITETKPHELREYLLNKKDMGWSLIGVEQTANSKNILHTKFEKKTILVLGNEKDGISANLIPLFDACIEIPQAGVIRSLNVHVSGAICVWQYAKQHILIESKL
ncbi:uncharacterized protein LOC108623164 [Ceratina calcarata]|uniref:Uncharacterized protein LOC108623164 n=1 Tax=Ceratina calcarata TaxID=156304 RepID=A0AAJ7ITW5_9HYME|nr:uncharacterized protein LOC108623164 [Ceratina calcarata]